MLNRTITLWGGTAVLAVVGLSGGWLAASAMGSGTTTYELHGDVSGDQCGVTSVLEEDSFVLRVSVDEPTRINIELATDKDTTTKWQTTDGATSIDTTFSRPDDPTFAWRVNCESASTGEIVTRTGSGVQPG